MIPTRFFVCDRCVHHSVESMSITQLSVENLVEKMSKSHICVAQQKGPQAFVHGKLDAIRG